jgi:chromosome segregation ATPase
MRTRALALFCLPLFACAAQDLKRVEDAALASVTGERRSEIARREGALEDARESLEAARRRRDAARLEQARARVEAAADAERLEELEDLAELARRLGLTAPLESFEAEQARLQRVYRAAETQAALAEAQLREAKAQVALREAEVRLADAQLESARAEAAKAAGGPLAERVVVSEFAAQLAAAQSEVGDLQQDAARATRALERARRVHEAALAGLPSEDADPAPELSRVRREKDQLEGHVRLLEKRIRELERENSRLMSRLVEVRED